MQDPRSQDIARSYDAARKVYAAWGGDRLFSA